MLSSDDDYECESLETLRADLEELKAKGNQLRLEYRREVQSLRSEFEPLLQTLHVKHENRTDHSIYHQIMQPSSSTTITSLATDEEKKDGGFEEISQQQMEEEDEEPQFTPFVRKIQSQLCQALHQQEVNQRQIKYAQRSNKRLIVYLSTEIEAQKAINNKRVADLEEDKKETESANQVVMDMLERDAVEQEEIITSLRLQLGMDPTPNSQRKNFRQRHRRRMQRISGGLRNLGRRVRETPKNIRETKVWKDLMAHEEEGDDMDASERRRGVIRRWRRSQNMDAEGNNDSPKSAQQLDQQQQQQQEQEPKNRFHSSKVEKLSLHDIEGNGRLGLVGRIRRSRQMRQGSNASVQDFVDKSILNDEPQRQPLKGVRRRASELRGLFRGQNSGKSFDSEDSNASTEPPTPPMNEKALYPMNDDMFSQEIFALSI